MQHLWTEVQHTHTPLCVYLASELLAFATRLTLAANGFHRHAVPGCCYYASGLAGAAVAEQTKSRPARAAAAAGAIGVSTGLRSRVGGVARRPRASRGSSGSGSGSGSAHSSNTVEDVCAAATPAAAVQQSPQQQLEPLVLLHGVGLGLLPYLGLLLTLARSSGRPLLAPVWRHVSLRLSPGLPTVEECADGVAAALAAHGASRGVLLGHSYGSCVAGRLAKTRPDVVAGLALFDPVCLGMWQPGLVRHFVFDRHISGCVLADVCIALLRSELHVAATMCRRFFWTSECSLLRPAGPDDGG